MKAAIRFLAILVCLNLTFVVAKDLLGQDEATPKPSDPPYNLWDYRDHVGKTFRWEIVGTAIGRVVGTDVYADDSRLSAAAVHAGVLRDGERGIIRVKILPGQNRYKGSTRNGVTSENDGKCFGSFRFVTDAARQPPAKVVSPLPAKTVVVWPVAVYQDADGHHHGSCHPVRITVGGQTPGTVQIAFAESEVGGAGPQWRAAGWTASLTAAEMTDFGALMTQVAFDVRGRIDGPSAGALMTIGILAAARGDAIRPDATMTGTINPDGFIGPVGGIVHKIEGAARAGKKLLVIPPGIAVQEHLDTAVPSNLEGIGERQGVQVVPA